jgi:hypothetical protein
MKLDNSSLRGQPSLHQLTLDRLGSCAHRTYSPTVVSKTVLQLNAEGHQKATPRESSHMKSRLQFQSLQNAPLKNHSLGRTQLSAASKEPNKQLFMEYKILMLEAMSI